MMNETLSPSQPLASSSRGATAAGSASMRYREMTSPLPGKSFWGDTLAYAQRVKYFDRTDWIVYIAWVGLMAGLVFSTFGFVLFGWLKGVSFPAYVWNLPLGTAIFVGAIAFDTIGHRTAYKDELKKGESLVHGITIFAGITSCILLTMCYHYPVFLRIPTAVFIIMSIFYSVIDEALHWRRYFSLYSDRVEMWSHFFIFLGHFIFVWAWWHWFEQGYPGVAETVAAMSLSGAI